MLHEGHACTSERVRYLAGGINLVDFIKYQIEQPQALVDLTRLLLAAIEELPGGGLHLGGAGQQRHRLRCARAGAYPHPPASPAASRARGRGKRA